MNLREIIKEMTKRHLADGNLLLGQCISAVGWVNGSVPDVEGIVELPCTDVSGAGIACGVASAGGRPIFIIRFQDFLMLNGSSIVNFAAKQKDIWGKKCPVFVRALNQEGKGTGPTHSAKLHSTFMHFPGLRIHSPITPMEWHACWNTYLENDDPMLSMEYKSTFDIEEEMPDHLDDRAVFTLAGIGTARINMVKAADKLREEGIFCNVVHLHQLKPFKWKETLIDGMELTNGGLVIDCGYDICGAGSWIAQKIGEKTGHVVHSMGLEDKSVGCSVESENATPSVEQIIQKIKEIIG